MDIHRKPTVMHHISSYTLQQKWAMVTKSSENKQFRHQMITFSKEKKNSSPKMYQLVTKYLFRHYRSWKKGKPRVTKYSRHQRLTRGDEILNSSPNIRM